MEVATKHPKAFRIDQVNQIIFVISLELMKPSQSIVRECIFLKPYIAFKSQKQWKQKQKTSQRNTAPKGSLKTDQAVLKQKLCAI